MGHDVIAGLEHGEQGRADRPHSGPEDEGVFGTFECRKLLLGEPQRRVPEPDVEAFVRIPSEALGERFEALRFPLGRLEERGVQRAMRAAPPPPCADRDGFVTEWRVRFGLVHRVSSVLSAGDVRGSSGPDVHLPFGSNSFSNQWWAYGSSLNGSTST